MRFLSFIILFGFFHNVLAQKPDIQVKLDTNHIRIGEQFHYIISTPLDNVKTVFPPADKMGLNKLKILKNYPIDTLKERLIKKYLITGFDSGYHYIPNQEINIGRNIYFTDSIAIKVTTVVVDTVNKKVFPIKPIAQEPIIFDDYKPYFYNTFLMVIGVIVLILIIYLAYKKYFLSKEKKKNSVVQLPPFEQAMARLKKLDEQTKQKNTPFYYVELTDIVRVYLSRTIKIPALEATSNEIFILFNRYLKRHNIVIEKKHIKDFKEFLDRSDFVKFANWKPIEHQIISDRKHVYAFIIAMKGSMDIFEKEKTINPTD